MSLRYCKIALVATNAFFLFLVVFNNLTDYGSNLLFVENVLNMSTTFEGNNAMWRAVETPFIHHLFYASIILWELFALIVIAIGTVKLWHTREAAAATFEKAKGWAAAGLTISMLQWYIAFIAVGGEWFLMWQSDSWNGQDAAMRMFLMMGLSLIFLTQREST
ncbi:MAG TPA: DUF2165 domain-containing protein [Oceanipulchritudo sp.]|nr:DUF2165 domain-containing protein [Oceanipulchritudo sp.]